MLDGIGAPAPDLSASIDTSVDTSIDTETPDISDDTPIDPFKGTKHKIKAKGKEIELDYETLLKRAEKAEGADQIFQENAATRKQVKELEAKVAKLSNPDIDPLELIELMGFENAKKFTDTFHQKQLEWEDYTPEQREQILRDYEAEQDRAELRSYKERESSEKAKKDQEIAISLVDKEVGEALAYAKEMGLSIAEAPQFAEQVVDELLAFLEYCDAQDKAGKPITQSPPSAKDVAKRLQERKDEETKSYLKRQQPKSVRSMLSAEQLEEIRQSQIDDLYATAPRSASKRQPAPEVIDPFQSQKAKPKSTKNWFDAMDQALGVKK